MSLGIFIIGLVLGLLGGYWIRGKVTITVKKKEPPLLIPADKIGNTVAKKRR
jgi:uncharacterized protein YneF (UPF0154 family)